TTYKPFLNQGSTLNSIFWVKFVLRLFASIHSTPSLNQGSVFSLRKCQIRISLMFLPLEGSRKNFYVSAPPPLCSSSKILMFIKRCCSILFHPVFDNSEFGF